MNIQEGFTKIDGRKIQYFEFKDIKTARAFVNRSKKSMDIIHGDNDMFWVVSRGDAQRMVNKGHNLVEQMQTGDVSITPAPLQPDMVYRGRPCFKINKKEMREIVRRQGAPDRVKNYVKSFGTGNVYMRYGTHLTFKYENIFK